MADVNNFICVSNPLHASIITQEIHSIFHSVFALCSCHIFFIVVFSFSPSPLRRSESVIRNV